MEKEMSDKKEKEIALAILMWLSGEGVQLREVQEVLREMSDYLSGLSFDASSLFKEINAQQFSSLSNQAQSSKQESEGLYPTPGLGINSFLNKLTVLNNGQNLKDMQNDNEGNNKKATLFKQLGKCLGDAFIEFKISFKEIEEINYLVNKMLRETIPCRKIRGSNSED